MRSLLLLSILVAAATACNQSLTHDMTGTGGTGTATGGGAGGTSPGTGGLGGSSPVCDALAAEYQSAVTAAETCQVGASGQCQQIVTATLSGCSCPTYVTDDSALSMLENAWQSAGCAVPTPECDLFCPAALNTACVAIDDGGGTGFCSYVPGAGGSGGGATGGTSGAGGSSVDGGLSGCSTLASEYAAALIGARSCSAGAAAQCGQQVPSFLSPCSSGCTELVTDSSVLDAIGQKWELVGCADAPVACPTFACAPAASASCVPSDAGGSVCSTSYGPLPTD